MTRIKYLCLDDDAGEVGPLLERIKHAGMGLQIEAQRPVSFDDQIKALSKRKLSGLILDLRLDQLPNEDGYRPAYRALALAQELRTRMTEGEIAPIPIVLWSSVAKLKASYDADTTGQDLFDATFRKGNIAKESTDVARRLRALATGYKTIAARAKSGARGMLFDLLAAEGDVRDSLDPRIGSELREGRSPAHDYAQLVLKAIFSSEGPLLEERTMLYRLGVTPESVGIRDLLTSISKRAEYLGIFAEGWPRYWAFAIEEWWRENVDEAGLTRGLPALARVEALTRAGFANLTAIHQESSHSQAFWTACAVSGEPLDPIEGVLIDTPTARPWQGPRFAKLERILDRSAAHAGIKVHPSERERVMRMKSHEG